MTCSSDLLNEKRKAIMSWAMKKKTKKRSRNMRLKSLTRMETDNVF